VAAPAFQTSGTTLTGTATTAAPASPSGAVNLDIIWLSIYIESTNTVTATGFTAVTNAPISCTGTGAHSVWNFWKRSTGSEPGTYSVAYGGVNAYRECTAQRISGCVTTGDPTEINNGAQRSSNGTGTPNVSGTTGGADRLLAWSGSNFTGTGTWTAPASPGTWALRGIGGGLATATSPFVTAGATGNVSGNHTATGFETGFLIAFLPVVTAQAPPVLISPYNSFH
jgi:hypothetical protein